MKFSEFKQIFKSLQTDEERKEFIRNRVSVLTSNSNGVEKIGMGINGSYSDFITPEIGMCSNEAGFFSNLSLDDLEVYENLMGFINNDVDNYMFGEPITISIIQKFIWKYFGFKSDNLGRVDVYSNDTTKNTSIKDLKEKNIAACSERSAMAHNLLRFLGIDSELIFGKINQKAAHAYIIFKSENGKRILYDPMNPVEYRKNDSIDYCPRVCLVSEEEYNQIKNGGTINFDYSLVKKLFVGNNEYSEKEIVYSCDDHLYKKSVSSEKDELMKVREQYIKMMSETSDIYTYPTQPDGTWANDMDLETRKQGGIKR